MKKGKEIDFKYNLHIYLSLLKNYKFLFGALVVLTLIIEGTHIFDKLVFKYLIDNGTAFAAKTLDVAQFIRILTILAICYGGIIIVKVVGKWLHLHMLNRLEANLMLDLKRKFFNHLIHLSHNFYTSNKTGALISRLNRGAKGMETLTDIIVWNLLPMVFSLILVGTTLFYLNWSSSVIIVVTMIIYLTYSIWLQNKQKQANIDLNSAEDIERANIADIFTNVESIKYFGKELSIKNRFLSLITTTRNKLVSFWNSFRYLDAGQSLIVSTGTLTLVYFAMVQFLKGEITLGTVAFIFTSYTVVTGELHNFVNGIRNYYRVMADFESLFQYNKIEQEIKDKKDAKTLKIKNGSVEFKNVTFGYQKNKLFKKFNLIIEKNKKIALVGPSGSGKTTLVKLLYRFYDVNSGKILVDNKNIKDLKQESLRSEMSIVPQECVLFDDTIYNNIKFSKPKASRKEVMNAIKFAQLDRIVKKFPNKENTIVGERGIKLSGGEKQRVSIARALLADKKILVLDEATSSLDSHTEHEIQRDLKKLMEGRTSIIIAHRLSTIMNSDVIVVLNQGKIVEMGTHNELSSKKEGLYNYLWNLQKGGYLK